MNLNTLNKDIKNNIIDCIIFKPKNKDELKKAVDLWYEDKEIAIKYYGHISLWNTSLIDDMSSLFRDKFRFNEDISNWDVSNVINMSYMFIYCKKFNQNINKWDVSSVTNMKCMFGQAHSFNQPLDSWDVSSVTTMYCMFEPCIHI